MLAEDLKRRICEQLALDYCCTPEEAANSENQFHVFEPLKGRRTFEERGDTFLKVTSFRNKLLFTGDERILEWCRSKYEQTEGAWFMEAGTMRELDRKLGEYGFCIDKAHPFFVPTDESLREAEESARCGRCGIQTGEDGTGFGEKSRDSYGLRVYTEKEIEAFRGDKRFGNAFTFLEQAPDVIGVAAFRDGEILGMAGASADSDAFWQIGIDVLPEARGLGIGRILVTRIRDEILMRDRVPYYGTAMSHSLSQNVAIGSGFRAAWAELTSQLTGMPESIL